ncbi:MAG TPA: YcfL family protein [Burkholderiales bacterium]|nr:YcfL family protein [Burkholderiales bacterium]
MNLKLTVLALSALLAAAGCASTKKDDGLVNGCPAGSSKVKSLDDLIEAKLEKAGSIPHIDVVDMRCSNRSGLLRIDADLKNTSRDVRRVAYRFRWLDREGMRAADDEAWKPLLIYGNTLYTITTTSPSQDAADFRLVLMDQDK